MKTIHAIRLLVSAFDDEYGVPKEVFDGVGELILNYMDTNAYSEFVDGVHVEESTNTCYSKLPEGHLWERIKSWYVEEVVKL